MTGASLVAAFLLLNGAVSGPGRFPSDTPVLRAQAASWSTLQSQAGEAGPSPAPDSRVEHLRSAERVLKWANVGALVVTSGLGTLAAINQPTLFGQGRCFTGSPVFGTYGCNRGLSTLHGSSAVASVVLYTADGVLTLAVPGAGGEVSEAARPWHTGLTYVHLTGIIAQPILGLIAAFPQVVWVPASSYDQFSKTMRTVHIGVGTITTAAFLATALLEH